MAASVPVDFKAALSNKILESFAELIPKDQLEQMIEEEIKKFFEVNSTEFKIEERCEGYVGGYSNGLYCHISPFRALVWQTVNKELKSAMDAYLTGRMKDVREELGKILISQPTPAAVDTYVDSLLKSAATIQQAQFVNSIMQAANSNIRNALGSIGADPNMARLVEVPFVPVC